MATVFDAAGIGSAIGSSGAVLAWTAEKIALRAQEKKAKQEAEKKRSQNKNKK